MTEDGLNTLFVRNEPPCGTVRGFDALRLARALGRRPGETVRVY